MDADDKADDRCEDLKDKEDDIEDPFYDLPDKAGALDRDSSHDGLAVIYAGADKVREYGDGDEWSNFDDYKVGDGEYDMTGVDDPAHVNMMGTHGCVGICVSVQRP